ncbi:dihydrodiol dehydrogenase [Amycolatopsis sp. NPDC057786]|uniref:dihydrodiol dehydrogenase n=1 Tax=Amycolatopsis sp. NPDC057786 TaxID=3346250 RepID=UPI00366C7847
MTIIHNEGRDPIIQIANEFTVIQVSYSSAGQRERLLVSSPRLGFQTLLDPLQLESLTWQTPEMYSKLLDTPYGPGVKLDARPLSALLGKD